ncbi:MAG TPA: cupin domain-containing protein [Hyalangium sp.]|nr:cupin domain-containing protein [Hyalangium sp.]
MPPDGFDFSRILSPLDPEVFFQEYWEQRPLVLSREAPDSFASLFSLEALEALLWSSRPGWGDVQLANHRRGEGWVDYTRQPPSLDRLARAHVQGDTLILNDVQLRSQSVARLCRSFEAVLNSMVNVNMYLTPKGAQGLAPHFDTQEVFVLQVRGSKHWRLYPPLVELPVEEMAGELPEGYAREPMMTVHLRAGDVLYMPRGVVHEALTGSEESLHLTVGVNVLTWKTLLEDVLRLVTESDVAFRRSLPVGFARRDDALPELRAGLETLLARLASTPWGEEAVERLALRYLAQVQPLPDADLRQAGEAQELGLDTRVRKRAGMFCRIRTFGESVRIDFPGGGIGGPKPIEPALRFAAGTEEFQVRDLPGGLSDRAKLLLARRLLAEGLLRRE